MQGIVFDWLDGGEHADALRSGPRRCNANDGVGGSRLQSFTGTENSVSQFGPGAAILGYRSGFHKADIEDAADPA